LIAITVVDTAITRGPNDLRFVVCLTCLALVFGALHGALFQLLETLASRLPSAVSLACWPLASLAGAAWLARALGGFSRLHGRYHALALSVLGVCAGAALVLGAALAVLQPHARARDGYLQSWPAIARRAVAAIFVVVAVGAQVADRRLQAELYPYAHAGLRLYGLWFGMFACALAARVRTRARWSGRAAGVLVLAALAPSLLLDARDTRTLQAFAGRRWPSLLLSLARTATDFDRDGYSSLFGGGDCAPFDPRRQPLAPEIPGNGIDDNCIAGDAKTVIEPPDRPLAARGPAPMDVVLVTIDSLRADHVGLYNSAYRRPKHRTTMLLDAWAKDAVVFKNAYTPGGWTSVALPALMHGRFPRRLRWTYFYETNYYEMIRKPFAEKLRPGERPERIYPLAFDDPHSPLAERLLRRGMRTAAVLDDGYSRIFQRLSGAVRGFQTYLETDREPDAREGDLGTIDLALNVLRGTLTTQRYFLWVHLFGVHGPDEMHPGAPLFGTSPTDLYDHEVAATDIELARLLAAIRQRGTPTAIFITADHGEELDTVPRSHGFSLNESIIHVPLIAKVPGWPAHEVQDPVSLVDLMPTILALTRTPAVPLFDGRDLGPLVHGVAQPYRVLLSDSWRLDASGHKDLEYVAAYDANNKLVYDRKRNLRLASDRERGDWRSVDWAAVDALSRAIDGYLDSTGGDLNYRE
jgi:hypothetical protein